jgi:hypothetical protein
MINQMEEKDKDKEKEKNKYKIKLNESQIERIKNSLNRY